MGCQSGRILIRDVPIERVSVTPSGMRIALVGLPRIESNKYQDGLENNFRNALKRSGLFAAVEGPDFDAGEVDFVLRMGRGTSASERRVNLAYFPLALGTLTLYIWFGGPIGTDIEFYGIELSGHTPDGSPLFSFTSRQQRKHWVNFYSAEYWAADAQCRGPNAGEAIAAMIEELATHVGHRTEATAQ